MMNNWYKIEINNNSELEKKAQFGRSPLGPSELSDKTRTSPFGNAGGDSHFGLFEPSSGKHHPNDPFSESEQTDTIEERLQKLKKERRKKKRKQKVILEKKTLVPQAEHIGYNFNKINVVEGQWGSQGPKIPTWKYEDWAGGRNYGRTPYKKKKRIYRQDESQLSSDFSGNIQKALGSTVIITTTFGQKQEVGSGFFISPNVVMTCSHVAVPNNDIQNSVPIIKFKGKEFRASVWAYDPSLDVAVLVVNDNSFQSANYLRLGNSSEAQIGENVLVIGNPLGFENVVGQGILSSEPMSIQGQAEYMFISSNIEPGNSGGPVLRAANNAVIGIAAAVISDAGKSSGLNSAIPIDSVKDFMLQYGVRFEFVR